MWRTLYIIYTLIVELRVIQKRYTILFQYFYIQQIFIHAIIIIIYSKQFMSFSKYPHRMLNMQNFHLINTNEVTLARPYSAHERNNIPVCVYFYIFFIEHFTVYACGQLFHRALLYKVPTLDCLVVCSARSTTIKRIFMVEQMHAKIMI